ncbi:GNAT acetyltransferase [Bacillus sp. OV322]|uniref:GNAT family N-acetyltransferase n=1 Tax=Bacillus sp. OV322 TaxID=1882764 RepID=UPI0008E3C697|nr:GNAT family N-acetyltransferase [Bacillus sp. OV322]SFC94551.1 GNAT acetyltransferase [Bacillus sp. OV322]
MTEINEPISSPAPLLFLGRTKEGSILRFNVSFPKKTLLEVIQMVNQNPANTDIGKIVSSINKVKNISNIWMGPAYIFPENFNRISSDIKITNENKGALLSNFPNLLYQYERRQPIFAIKENGSAVSVCCSAKRNDKAAEASVETLEAYRGKGYAMECTIAWVKEIQKIGGHALYSTAWDNFRSQAIAKKLNLYQYGMDLHMS